MVAKNEVVNNLENRKQGRIQICFAVVLYSWSRSSKKLELNCAIGMVYSLKFFECSSATPSTEIDSKPDNYLE